MQKYAPLGDEEQFHNLILKSIDHIAEGVLIIDKSGKIVFANNSTERLTKYSKRQLVGKIITAPEFKIKSIDGKPIAIEKRPFFQVIKKGQPLTGVRTIVERSDGVEIVVESCLIPMKTNDDISHLVISFKDVTKIKESEDKLREAEFYFRQMLEKIKLVALLLDIRGNITFANDYLLELTGWKRKEVVGKNWFDLFIPEDNREIIKQIFSAVVAGGQLVTNYENEILTKKHVKLMLAFTNTTIRGGFDDNVVAIASIAQDITERRKIERELQESKQRYKIVAETAVDAVIQCMDGKVIYWNKSAERIFGYKADEIVGKPVPFLIPERFAEEHTKGVERFTTRRESKIIGKKPYEAYAKRKDGTEVPIELSVAENKYSEGISFTGIIRDISERKEAEKKLKSSYETANKIATTLQKSMLPIEIPEIEGLEIKFYYQATGEGEVGGDFYDVFKTALGAYGILIGDVSGKGIEVAAETARVRYLFHDKAFDGSRPDEVMYSVNNSLARQKIAHFTALTYALFDPISSTLEISNAGNPFPYAAYDDKFLEISGVPISLMIKEKYDSTILKLERGNLVLIYTDGIVEARREKELFGEERIRKLVLENKNLKLDYLLKSLVKEARTFSNNHLRDDILVVGIKKK